MSTIHVSHRRVTAAPTPVNGDLSYEGETFKKMPGPFGQVTGSVVISRNLNLLTLKDGPQEVGKDFSCYGNPKLQSLLDGPYRVGGGYRCSNNASIRSLHGSPVEVPGSYNCANNNHLTSFVGAPKKVGLAGSKPGNFKASSCSGIHSLEGLPAEVGGSLLLDMLVGLKDISDIWRHCKSVNGKLDFTGTEIERGGLGILLIKGVLDIVSEQRGMQIIKKYLGTGPQGVMRCRKELVENGLSNFATM